MHQLRRATHFSHIRHSGRLLPHAHTSYPVLALLLLCTGVILMGWTRFAGANQVSVSGTIATHAKVMGSAPKVAATFATPSTGMYPKTAVQVEQGTCPQNTYVEIMRNGISSGQVLCSLQGTFNAQVSLLDGANQLVAQVRNMAGLAGPPSTPITVYYNRPDATINTTDGGSNIQGTSQPVNDASSVSKAGSVSEPLILKTEFRIGGFYTGSLIDWPLGLSGGLAPYAVTIDWGDNTAPDLLSLASAGAFDPQHTYTKHGAYKGSYVIKATVSDATGSKSFLQTVVIVNDLPTNAAIVSSKKDSSGGLLQGVNTLQHSASNNVARYIWPSYGGAVLLVFSFWLGERQELHVLRLARGKHSHR